MKILLFYSLLVAPVIINFVSAAPCDCSDLKHIKPSEQSCLLNQLLHVISHLVSCGEHKFSPKDYKTLLEATKCGHNEHKAEEVEPKENRQIASSHGPLFPITLPADCSSQTDGETSDSTSEESTEETTDVDKTVEVSTESDETSEDTSSTEEDIAIEITKPNGTTKKISIEITSDSTSKSTDPPENKKTTEENIPTEKEETDIKSVAHADEPQPDTKKHMNNNPTRNNENKHKCDCDCFPSDAQVLFIPVMSFHNAPGLTPQKLKDYLFNKISLPN